MTVLEAIEQLTAERKKEENRTAEHCLPKHLRQTFDQLVRDGRRARKTGRRRINPHRGYAERQICKT